MHSRSPTCAAPHDFPCSIGREETGSSFVPSAADGRKLGMARGRACRSPPPPPRRCPPHTAPDAVLARRAPHPHPRPPHLPGPHLLCRDLALFYRDLLRLPLATWHSVVGHSTARCTGQLLDSKHMLELPAQALIQLLPKKAAPARWLAPSVLQGWASTCPPCRVVAGRTALSPTDPSFTSFLADHP